MWTRHSFYDVDYGAWRVAWYDEAGNWTDIDPTPSGVYTQQVELNEGTTATVTVDAGTGRVVSDPVELAAANESFEREADERMRRVLQDPNASLWDKAQAIEARYGIEALAQLVNRGVFPESFARELGPYIAARQSEADSGDFVKIMNTLIPLAIAAVSVIVGVGPYVYAQTGATAGAAVTAGESVAAGGAAAESLAVTAPQLESAFVGFSEAATADLLGLSTALDVAAVEASLASVPAITAAAPVVAESTVVVQAPAVEPGPFTGFSEAATADLLGLSTVQDVAAVEASIVASAPAVAAPSIVELFTEQATADLLGLSRVQDVAAVEASIVASAPAVAAPSAVELFTEQATADLLGLSTAQDVAAVEASITGGAVSSGLASSALVKGAEQLIRSGLAQLGVSSGAPSSAAPGASSSAPAPGQSAPRRDGLLLVAAALGVAFLLSRVA